MNAANDFETDLLKLMINSFLWKNSGNFTKKNQCAITKRRKFFKILVSQHTLLIKFVVKIVLLFMKLDKF